MRHVIGVDPSGSYKEGKGTTGIAVLNEAGKLVMHTSVYASDYLNRMQYWAAVCDTVETLAHTHNGVVSMEDYVLYAHAAKAQINSEMETSKLIGAIMLRLYECSIPLYMRPASQVMNRWANHILEHEGFIRKEGKTYGTTAEGFPRILAHELDALRHAAHCFFFELGKENKEVT